MLNFHGENLGWVHMRAFHVDTPIDVVDVYDDTATWYENNYDSKFHAAEDTVLSEYLRRHGYTHGRILDLACGTGLTLDLLGINSSVYRGVDASLKMLDVAQRKYPNHGFLQADFREFAHKLGSFRADVVLLLFGALSYVPDLDTVLTEIARASHSGTRVFLQTYTPRYVNRNSYILNRTGQNVPFFSWSTNEWERALTRRGFFHPVKQWGFSLATEAIPGWVPQSVFNAWLSFEVRGLSELPPHWSYFHTVEAIRR